MFHFVGLKTIPHSIVTPEDPKMLLLDKDFLKYYLFIVTNILTKDKILDQLVKFYNEAYI